MNNTKIHIKNILKKIVRQFIPPLFYPWRIREIFNYIFKKTNYINLEVSFFKRHAFINKAISKYSSGSCKYLEIGVADNDVFNSIPLKLKNKFGVDPFTGGNYKMTSDVFFEKYSHIKFDVIFIDGLHHYLQCQKDTINAINSLNKNGIIFLHDLLPKNPFEQNVPREQGVWTGDVWKVAVELSNSENCEFKIINTDSGIGILKITDNFKYKKMPKLLNANYKDFLEHYKYFKLINSEEALEFINNI